MSGRAFVVREAPNHSNWKSEGKVSLTYGSSWADDAESNSSFRSRPVARAGRMDDKDVQLVAPETVESTPAPPPTPSTSVNQSIPPSTVTEAQVSPPTLPSGVQTPDTKSEEKPSTEKLSKSKRKRLAMKRKLAAASTQPKAVESTVSPTTNSTTDQSSTTQTDSARSESVSQSVAPMSLPKPNLRRLGKD